MLSKTAEYALRAVVCLGREPAAPVSADTLADQTQVPRRYLTRVLQDLCTAGMVRSRPGPGGGYELVKAAGKLTILDVVNVVDPIQRITSCPLGLDGHKKLCPLHAQLDRAYAATEAAFAAVSIQSLVDSASPIAPLCDAS